MADVHPQALTRSHSTMEKIGRIDGVLGVGVRVGLLAFFLVFTLGAACAINTILPAPVVGNILLAAFLIVAIPFIVGLICSEFPQGADWLMFRLGVATFCRTGLPLLFVILVDEIAAFEFSDAAIGFLAFFYVVGFFASVCISLLRFKALESLGEVERAIV